MKNKLLIISLIILCILIMWPIFISRSETDENMLYRKKFQDVVLKIERYDYVVGQQMTVGVEKSTDKGKHYTRLTDVPVVVSMQARFLFLNESLVFIDSTGYVNRNNDFVGFKVSQDGGKTFQNAKFNYVNERVDLITIEDLPYYDGDTLKLNCSVYDVTSDRDGYQDMKIVFSSVDNGLTWNL